jgi:hypothetical protein
VELDVTPEQPAEVERLLAELVGPPPAEVDPWWQAGLDDALDA